MADTSTEQEIDPAPNPDADEGMPPPAEGAPAPEGDSAGGEPTDAPDSLDVVEEHSPGEIDDSEPSESSELAETPEPSDQLDSPEEAEKGEESDVAEQESSDPEESDASEDDEEGGNEPLESDPTQTQSITDDQEAAPNSTPPSTLRDRYDIYPGRPLEELDSPSARAFEAEDRMQPQLKLFALICIPALPVRWNEILDIVGDLVPGNMSLASCGNIDWPIIGQKCLALVFERPLGGRVDHFLKAPEVPEYKKLDVIRLVAETGIKALTSLNERGLTNRSIRPDNIFFADDEHDEVVFGEFVSSPPGFDQPIVFETIERSMAGEGGRGPGTIAEDIYALGATLAFLLQRHNPVRGKSREQLILAKITHNSYQTLVGKTLLTASLLEPMRGMMNDNPAERWGFDELDLWFSGRRVTPVQVEPTNKSQRPFRFGDYDHVQARTLAFSMSERRESALKLIKDGSIEQWYAKSLEDVEMAAVIATAMETAAAQAETVPHADEVLLSKILMLMDPRAPITYKNAKYMPDGLGAAIGIEVLRNGDVKTLAESIVNEIPALWYDIADSSAATQFTELEFFARIRTYLQKAGPGFGMERCLYESIPGYSCQSPIIVTENVYAIERYGADPDNYLI